MGRRTPMNIIRIDSRLLTIRLIEFAENQRRITKLAMDGKNITQSLLREEKALISYFESEYDVDANKLQEALNK
ncbi:gp37 [Listeria phage P40]|uniref:gp37 n=1 Tax=Listeria phage P40 TaxID=560178 RepID=UPI00018198EB|nr:gp37 [Listeria phage P40]ACI00397.1 gp37 [Listeria phage P40]